MLKSRSNKRSTKHASEYSPSIPPFVHFVFFSDLDTAHLPLLSVPKVTYRVLIDLGTEHPSPCLSTPALVHRAF
ncbi:hypothetical protein BC567DRAFT_228733 [Phyllosticta citribraziliensis]